MLNDSSTLVYGETNRWIKMNVGISSKNGHVEIAMSSATLGSSQDSNGIPIGDSEKVMCEDEEVEFMRARMNQSRVLAHDRAFLSQPYMSPSSTCQRFLGSPCPLCTV